VSSPQEIEPEHILGHLECPQGEFQNFPSRFQVYGLKITPGLAQNVPQ
jgi:hypothetical protein